MNLYQIAGEYREMIDRLADLDLPEEVIRDTIEAESGALANKARNIVMLTRSLDARERSIDAEIERLCALRDKVSRRSKGLKSYLQGVMTANEIDRIPCDLFDISLRRGVKESVMILNPAAISPQFLRVPAPEYDKQAIKAALKMGNEVAGATLVKEDYWSLQIK